MKRLLLSIISFLTLLPLYAEEDHSILYDWRNFDPILSDDRAPDIYPIAVDGLNIYVGTSYGIIIIDKATKQQTLINRTDGLTDNYISFLGVIGDELWYGGHDNSFGMIKDGKISNFPRSYTHPNSTVWITAIEKDLKGNLWVGSFRDLLKFNNGIIAGRYPFPDSDFATMTGINDILVDDDGTIWVSGYNIPGREGLAKLTGNGIEMVYEELGLISDIIKDHQGNMWMAGYKGLLKYHNGTFTEYLTDKNGNSLADMTNLTEDKEGNFWALRESCLVKYDKEQITSYQAPFLYLFDMVMDDDGIYISANHNGVLIFKDGEFEHIPLQKFPGQLPLVMGFSRGGSIDHDGNYLAGTSSGHGLLKLKADGTCIETNYFKGKYITETVADNFGDVWVANSWGEHFYLYKITPTDTLMYDESSGCPHLGEQEIFQMAVDHQNRLWIASSNGLYCFDGTTWHTYNKNNSGLTTNRVYCVAFDKDDRLWTSCGRSANNYYAEIGDGLFCYDGITWTHYISQYDDEVNRATEGYVPLKMPVRSNSIGRIVIDESNTFWLSINYNEVYITSDIDEIHGGLIRWDGKDEWHQYLSPYTPDPTLPTYEPGEWIDNVDFVLPGNWINDIDIDRYGRLWVSFEGKHGVAVYDGKDFTVWDTDVPGIRYGCVFNLCIDKERDRLWISHPYEHGASTAKIRHGGTDMLSSPRLSPDRHQSSSGKMYNLSGRQIDNPQKGVYIQNGKKRVIK